MSTITEIQAAIGRLPLMKNQMSEAEEAALLASLDKAAAQLDAGASIPVACVREDIRRWAAV